MRDLADLVRGEDDALTLLHDWVAKAPHGAEILSVEGASGEQTLLALQVTTRSVLGALAFHTGGVLVDHGWLRHLGAGHRRIGSGLSGWNESLGGTPLDPPLAGVLIVAWDVLGGVFAINDHGFDAAPGSLHYFAPDTQRWEPIAMGHGDFVAWTMTESLDAFYGDWRWPGWEEEVASLGPDQGIHVWPPLGFEKEPLAYRSRRPASFREMWSFTNQIGRQAGSLPDGAQVRFHVAWKD